jgi:hypothetical protein
MDVRARATFAVAVDGSDVSYAAMRLALTLMHPADTILVVTVLEPGATLDASTLLKNAQVEALKMHTITMDRVHAEALPLKDGQNALDVLTRIANNKCKTFVMGASGKGYEAKGKARTVGAAHPLGASAEHLLYHCARMVGPNTAEATTVACARGPRRRSSHLAPLTRDTRRPRDPRRL